jgi:hypothetical protein
MIEVLHIAGAHHRYGGLTALDALDMTVRAGECAALLGPNGVRQECASGSSAVRARRAPHRRRSLPTSDFAATLHLAEGTVRNYLSAAITTLGVRNRIEAARVDRDRGWL